MKSQLANAFPSNFVLLTYGFTWLVLLPAILSVAMGVPLPLPALMLVAIAQFGPSLTAFILTYRHNGRRGVVGMLRRALDPRIPLRWLAVITLLPCLLGAAALALTVLSGGELPPLTLLSQPIAIVPTFVFILLLQGPLPEEFGWRGYLLDRLQLEHSALTASLILGSLWALWHLPLFYLGYLPFPFWAYFFAVVALSVLITWVYNNTGGNLLSALLFHATFNLAIQLFPPMSLSGGDTRGFLILAALYVLAAGSVVALSGAQTLTDRRSPTLGALPAAR